MPDVAPAVRTTLFGSLSDAQWAALIEEGRWISFHPGEEIFHQGDLGDVMFFIMQGLVEVNRVLGNRGPHFIRMALGEGEFFGEMALLEERPRSATVTALEPTQCLVVNRDQLVRLLQMTPALSIAMLTVMSRRLRAISA